MTLTPGPLRVVTLRAENFKKLTAVEITPDPAAATVTIAGRNAQGKSSVIDAIWVALAGGAAIKGSNTTRPIRDGQDFARVQVDLGDIIVTRTWTGDRTTLTVESQDGAKYSSPQKMLDSLIGRLSFDPLAFSSLPPKTQLAELLQLVELPFDVDKIAAARQEWFDQRTNLTRLIKTLNGQLEGYGPFADDLPATEVSVTDALDELRVARNVVADAQKNSRIVDERRATVDRLEAELLIARSDLSDAEAVLATCPIVLPDLDAMEHELGKIDETNTQIRARNAAAKVDGDLKTACDRHDALTAKIVDLDKRKSDALAAATFPVDGLGFTDDGVTFGGVPFAQCSAAERLRVSVAMSMALNPTVRIIRITDGSLLDSANLAIIEAMADEQGFQVWVEVVDESGTVGITIEDGAVKA